MSPKEKKDKEGKKVKDLQKELENCRKERDEYLKGWQRSRADFTNYKKGEEERFKMYDWREKEDLMRELATVLDSFDLALASEGEMIEKKGVELIEGQLVDILRRRGFEKINVGRGDEFDPNFHEVVEQVDSSLPPGQIVEEMRKGYIFKGKVLRPSRVKVSKGKSETKI